jgi:hypothetical protein
MLEIKAQKLLKTKPKFIWDGLCLYIGRLAVQGKSCQKLARPQLISWVWWHKCVISAMGRPR